MNLKLITFRNLWRRKGKAAFVIAGLVIGVSTVVGIISFVEAMTSDINHKLEKYGANILIVPRTENLTLTYGGLSLGCAGGVLALANVAPEECVRIHELVQHGDFNAARQIQLRMIPVNQAVTATYGVAGLKTALDLRGYFGGEPRAPLMPSSDDEKAAVVNILKEAGLLS